MAKREVITALDIGSSKVVFAVAEYVRDNEIATEIVSHGVYSCSGVSAGTVANMEVTAKAIEQALDSIRKGRYPTDDVIVNISGQHVESRCGRGLIAVGGEEITDVQIEMAKMAARQVDNLPSGYEVVSVIPRDFIVDGKNSIVSPKFMVAQRLEAEAYVCVANSQYLENINRVVNLAGLQIHKRGLVPSALVSALSVLTEDEKDVGAACIDIGHGVIDLAVFRKGAVLYSASVGLGGSSIIADVSNLFNISELNARHQIETIGVADAEYLDKNEAERVCSVESVSRNDSTLSKFTRGELADVISARLDDFFDWIKKQFEYVSSRFGLRIPSVIFTGGVSGLNRLAQRANKVLQVPVRIAQPCYPARIPAKLAKSEFSTVIGLLIYGINYLSNEEHRNIRNIKLSWIDRLNDWFDKLKWF
ncbi:cell division protein FtsA [bacterium]|nr:cell division protein FtsA [bacterium]